MNGLFPSLDHWHAQVLNPRAARWLPVAIYGTMLIQLLILLPHADLLWGTNSILLKGTDTGGVLENFMYQLIYYPQRANMVLWIHAIALVPSLLWWRWTFPFRLIAWITGLMLYFAAYQAFNSGTLLLLLFAFFLIPVTPAPRTAFRKLLTNLSWYACLLQLVLVYAISAGIKWTGEMWPSGSAIYYAFSIDRFSQPWIIKNIHSFKGVLMVLTWLVLLYQSAFGILVWVKKWRRHLVITGAILHAAIGIFMNLPVFGLAMIAAYVLFVDEWRRA